MCALQWTVLIPFDSNLIQTFSVMRTRHLSFWLLWGGIRPLDSPGQGFASFSQIFIDPLRYNTYHVPGTIFLFNAITKTPLKLLDNDDIYLQPRSMIGVIRHMDTEISDQKFDFSHVGHRKEFVHSIEVE